MLSGFGVPGQWYQANLHAHTTESDGRLSPAEAAICYRRQGYQVLAITDHGKVTPCAELSHRDFLCLEGIEIGAGQSELGHSYHVVGVGVPASVAEAPRDRPQPVLDAIAQAGGVGFIAHPYWSCLVAHDLLGLTSCLGIELINYGCEIEIGKGVSTVHWDDLLVRGERLLGLGVDDGHRCGWDFYGGFTMIRATELTREAILDALRAGDFYASMGPRIHDLRLTKEGLEVECTPAAAINFLGNNQQGWCMQKEDRPPLTGARYLREGSERYVRVEVVSETGLRAWSQPVWF
jgi:hypothetical protein